MNYAQPLGQPKYLSDRLEGRSNLQLEGLVEEERRPASDSSPPLRPEGLTKEEQR
jgi:hypothetical protein